MATIKRFNKKSQAKTRPPSRPPSFVGKKKQDRQAAYAQFVCDTVPEGEIKLIRDALQRGQLTGSERFRREVSRRLGIRISNKGPGRPKKANK